MKPPSAHLLLLPLLLPPPPTDDDDAHSPSSSPGTQDLLLTPPPFLAGLSRHCPPNPDPPWLPFLAEVAWATLAAPVRRLNDKCMFFI